MPRGSRAAGVGGVEDMVLIMTPLGSFSLSLPFCSCCVGARDSRFVDRRAGTGSGWDSELPEVPLAGFLVLPSFLEANWLSSTSTDDVNGGGIFHAARPVRL